MTDPEKLRALIAEIRTIALVSGQCSVEGPDDGEHALMASQAELCSRWADTLSTLLAEAEPSMGASMGDSMGNPDRTPHSAAVYDFDKESRIVCEAIGSPVGRMTVACALHEAYRAGQAERPTHPVEDANESPVLAFQDWLSGYTATHGKLDVDAYFLAQAAFFAAHPGRGPTSTVMTPPVEDAVTRAKLEEAAREFLAAAEDYRIHSEVLFDGDISYTIRMLKAREALRAHLKGSPE
jgi:hypothetical protein